MTSLPVQAPALCTRFPPEPSGRLHAGHIKSIMYNYSFSKQKKGRFILRFDDSNPETCTQEYVDYIQEDIKLMGIIPDDVYYMSNYFDTIEKYMTDLICNGMAYVDTDDSATITLNRRLRKDSVSRTNTIAENLVLWDGMRRACNTYVARLKINMTDNNGSLRDPIAYRVCPVPHYRTAQTHNVYPLFDFISPIVDALQNVTHIMRTGEFIDKIPLHKWILEQLNMPKPVYKSFSRMNLSHTILSKRKLRTIVENTDLDWEHPMIPTIRGLYNRGLRMDAFLQFFAKNMSFKTNRAVDDWDCILKINRTLIDRSCYKLFALGEDMVSLKITLPSTPVPKSLSGDVYVNMMNKDLGTRDAHYPDHQVFIDRKDHGELVDGQKVLLLMYDAYEYRDGCLTLISKDGLDLKSTYKMSWLAESHYVKVTLMICNALLTKPVIEDGDDIMDILSVPLFKLKQVYVEDYILSIEKGQTIQLYRMGYFIAQSINPYVLVHINEPGNTKQFLLNA